MRREECIQRRAVRAVKTVTRAAERHRISRLEGRGNERRAGGRGASEWKSGPGKHRRRGPSGKLGQGLGNFIAVYCDLLRFLPTRRQISHVPHSFPPPRVTRRKGLLERLFFTQGNKKDSHVAGSSQSAVFAPCLQGNTECQDLLSPQQEALVIMLKHLF